ncbi:DNA methyltransferase [Marinobacter orientalis]|uniref:DNA methylase N-4/N-6 domain-containing protein n=1 Tax=Marinobacter orientalis TaxID=1928859 RepID=A0A7Y0RC09_9GAMM|nr:DNA methyltransferase [Marinobacter orientalis]NMT63453.1 hypothetical protein [Marinobacter orientalis]TGX48514.1 hypothetical protein DIT72_14065 [Marinobacter orientalis]
MYNQDLFEAPTSRSSSPIFQQYLPLVTEIAKSPHSVKIWDIPYTIPQLSYLVHGDYRYYGKFPSVVAGQILEQIPRPTSNHYVLDNFCGSGTTLVEANLRGIKSYGIDISWLSVLASNVKARVNDTEEIKIELGKLVAWFEKNHTNYEAPSDNFSEKWFTKEASIDLKAIQDYLYKMPDGDVKDFLLIGYIGIVRRVSKAHDGEVRPHIKKEKRQRNVISAFSKKIQDMCKNHNEYKKLIGRNNISKCFLGDNTELPKQFSDNLCYLVISHPPYLNSFNYAPVYSLEYYWGKPFESFYTNNTIQLYKSEMKAHPASENIVESYFEHLKKCYTETYQAQPKGSYLAVVIGDCTRKGELIPVCQRTIQLITKIGYKLEEENYRTTHYGLGKYAYRHRADYHGDDKEKKDGILIFRK